MDNFEEIESVDEDITELDVPQPVPAIQDQEKTELSRQIGRVEEQTGVHEQGVFKWVYDPANIFQQFELYLRGIHLNHSTGEFEQLYKGYYINEEGEKTWIPYKLMNDRGINDAMSLFTIYVNKVTSFSRYNSKEIDQTMRFVLFSLHERYIIHKCKDFEIDPKDGYITVNTMYDLIRSGWRQSLGGSSLNMLGKSTKVTEVIGQGGSSNKKPMWKFW